MGKYAKFICNSDLRYVRTYLFLIDDTLDEQSHREDPAEHHEEWEGARDASYEPVSVVTRIRELL